MTNFTVIYEHPTSGMFIVSRVFDVDANNFLIIDNTGHFKWVPMKYCTLEGGSEG